MKTDVVAGKQEWVCALDIPSNISHLPFAALLHSYYFFPALFLSYLVQILLTFLVWAAGVSLWRRAWERFVIIHSPFSSIIVQGFTFCWLVDDDGYTLAFWLSHVFSR